MTKLEELKKEWLERLWDLMELRKQEELAKSAELEAYHAYQREYDKRD